MQDKINEEAIVSKSLRGLGNLVLEFSHADAKLTSFKICHLTCRPVQERVIARGCLQIVLATDISITYMKLGKLSHPLLPRLRAWRSGRSYIFALPSGFWRLNFEAGTEDDFSRLDSLLSRLITYQLDALPLFNDMRNDHEPWEAIRPTLQASSTVEGTSHRVACAVARSVIVGADVSMSKRPLIESPVPNGEILCSGFLKDTLTETSHDNGTLTRESSSAVPPSLADLFTANKKPSMTSRQVAGRQAPVKDPFRQNMNISDAEWGLLLDQVQAKHESIALRLNRLRPRDLSPERLPPEVMQNAVNASGLRNLGQCIYAATHYVTSRIRLLHNRRLPDAAVVLATASQENQGLVTEDSSSSDPVENDTTDLDDFCKNVWDAFATIGRCGKDSFYQVVDAA